MTVERTLRVGHNKTFARYFAMGIPDDDISQADMDAIVRAAGEPSELESIWKILRAEGKEMAALSRLRVYLDEVPVTSFPGFITASCNIGDDMPEEVPGELFSDLPARRLSGHIFTLLMSRVTDIDGRCGLLQRGISNSRGIRVPVYLVPLHPEQKEEQRSEDKLVSEEGARGLIGLLLERLAVFAENGRLRSSLELRFILCRWAVWAGESKGLAD
jgi:hypothetical protein